VDVFVDAEMVARGAAVQAAATLAGTDPAEVAAAWRPNPDSVVDPAAGLDRVALRTAYHALRDREPI
jgi:hypothetical protein